MRSRRNGGLGRASLDGANNIVPPLSRSPRNQQTIKITAQNGVSKEKPQPNKEDEKTAKVSAGKNGDIRTMLNMRTEKDEENNRVEEDESGTNSIQILEVEREENSKDIKDFLQIALEKMLQELKTVKLEIKGEIQKVEGKLDGFAEKIRGIEETQEELKSKVDTLERDQQELKRIGINLQLQIEGLEDKQRQCNICLKGFKDNITYKDLYEQLPSLLNKLLNSDEVNENAIKNIWLIPKNKKRTGESGRVVICRLESVQLKESILKKAWESGGMEHEDMKIQILADLSGRTLQRRNKLKPLTKYLREQKIIYKWGIPLTLTIRMDDQFFRLESPDQIIDLFKFLHCEPFEILDWVEI